VTAPKSPIKSVRDIGSAEMIQIMGVESDWLHLFEAAGMALPKGGAGITVDTSLAALEIVASGHGAALVLSRFAAAFEAEGRVRRVPGIELPHEQSHYLLTPLDFEAPRAEALLFSDWLRQELAAEAAQSSPSEEPGRAGADRRRRRSHGK
jgi:LysR family glycine cleavage system transcriptional activator